ncbi:MAG: hypothetical protein LBP61_08260 [Desulfovibrio sp.]|jgi:hypothetical protein|nr:hypothetical protein [Desulfovibrio sp.]
MALPKSGKVKVIFHNTDGAIGKHPIFAQLNGESIRIPRNQEVEIDVKWLRGVFDIATKEEYDTGPDGRGIAVARTVLRYPYQVISADEESGGKAKQTQGAGE